MMPFFLDPELVKTIGAKLLVTKHNEKKYNLCCRGKSKKQMHCLGVAKLPRENIDLGREVVLMSRKRYINMT